MGTIEDILGRCRGPETEAPEKTSDHGRLIAYGGSFGTGLLARAPLEEQESIVFEASVNARGALHSSVSLGRLGKARVFAAHLSPGGAEQEPQVEHLLAWVESHTGGAPVILLGDLNTTPGSTLFGRFERAGFREADFPDPRGTFGHGGLGTGKVVEGGFRLDHILFRGLSGKIRTQRILDQPVTIPENGRSVKTTLSDHFGLMAIIDEA